MIQLSNNCSITEPSVFPRNWQNGGPAILQIEWRIQYYFRDTAFPGKKKLVIVKGMNQYKTLAERREMTQHLLANELRNLKDEGYNPIRKIFRQVEHYTGDIALGTKFIPALNQALQRLVITPTTKIEIKSVMKLVEQAAVQLGLLNYSIDQITRRHIKSILERCGLICKRWSNNRYNKVRAYLMMLYKELVEQEAVPSNFIRDISKKPVVSRIKTVLTSDQRKTIDRYLAEKAERFRQFVHLFFHSGGRKTELLQLKPSMINLERQTYRCIVKKGKQLREVERIIKTIAIPFWQYFLANCPDDQFIFGLDFNPGSKPMGIDLPTRYWQQN